MNLPTRLVRLYPDSFRSRWGGALENEARASGWQTHLDMVISIADVWLHPVIWPAHSLSQRRGRAAAMGATVALSCWFLAHLAVEHDASGLSGPGRSTILMASAVTMLGGLIVISPRPYLSPRVVSRITRLAIRRLTLPMLLAATVIALVHTAVANVHNAMLRGAMLEAWWLALAVGTVQLARLAGSLSDELARPPSSLRLQVGMWTLAAAGAAAGATFLSLDIQQARIDALSTGIGAALIILTAVLVSTLRDVSRLPTPKHGDC